MKAGIHSLNIMLALIAGVYQAAAQTHAMPVTNGLVSWWQAESNALDSVGGNNGTLEPGVQYGPGRVGSGFLFDGNFDGLSGGVNLGNVADFDYTAGSSFTISAWFDCFGTNAPTSNGDIQDGQQIICLNYGCTDPLTAQSLSIPHAGGPLSFFVRDIDGNNAGISSVATPTFNTFHHAVGIRDATTTTIRLYLDGVLVGSVNDPTTATLTGDVNDLIGRRNACNSYNVFYGLIDEVMIYNRALSSDEVQQIYLAQGGLPSLSISNTAQNVVISWPSPYTGFVLQQNSDLTTTNWTSFDGTINSNSTTMSATITPAAGNLFFRLKQ